MSSGRPQSIWIDNQEYILVPKDESRPLVRFECDSKDQLLSVWVMKNGSGLNFQSEYRESERIRHHTGRVITWTQFGELVDRVTGTTRWRKGQEE